MAAWINETVNAVYRLWTLVPEVSPPAGLRRDNMSTKFAGTAYGQAVREIAGMGKVV